MYYITLYKWWPGLHPLDDREVVFKFAPDAKPRPLSFIDRVINYLVERRNRSHA